MARRAGIVMCGAAGSVTVTGLLILTVVLAPGTDPFAVVGPAPRALAWQQVAGELGTLAALAAGVVLTARRRELGLAVLVGVAALAVADLVGMLAPLPMALGAGAAAAGLVLMLVWGPVLAAGVLAWRARDPDRWTWRAPVAWPYVAVAAVVIVAGLFPWVGVPSGAPLGAGLRGALPLDLSPTLLLRTLVLATVLAAAARLPRPLAAGLLLAVVAALLPVALLAVRSGIAGDATVTAAGWLALAAATGLGVAAVWWTGHDRRVAEHRRATLRAVVGAETR